MFELMKCAAKHKKSRKNGEDMKKLLTIAGLVLLGISSAQGQPLSPEGYPAKPVRIFVPFAPGGATDYIARVIAEKLSTRLGQTFVVENRPGAGGAIGAEAALRSPPDGYTLLIASASYTVNPAVIKLKFDPVEDAQPVVNLVVAPSVFLVSKETPVATLGELVAYAKANPDKLNYATQGTGSITHVTTEAFLASTSTKMVHVPYKGVGPALNALAANEVQVLFTDPGAAQGLAKAGKIKLLAVAGNRRLEQFPEVQTAAEAGLPQLSNYGSWQGMFAPKGTPVAIVDVLNKNVNAILSSPEMVGIIRARFALPVGGTSADFAARVKSDIQRYGDIARRIGIEPQ
ncbi:Bug family tripartite tricarboxylate transporter substrate binding protein [Allopusillimonas ginsengisoli]|uniref:Bug family tripartite tricarboxylate transporter substrate binding protein n=1 Tax=Allopusillimonas ginsengisoli TaxID=453575 RepID=UPI0039C2BB9D